VVSFYDPLPSSEKKSAALSAVITGKLLRGLGIGYYLIYSYSRLGLTNFFPRIFSTSPTILVLSKPNIFRRSSYWFLKMHFIAVNSILSISLGASWIL
jgi:hypothetical protein